jgi:hypothetical protein
MSHDEFRAFYEEHARRLWAYVAKLSGCQSTADDIVQEAFLRMMTANLPINMSLGTPQTLSLQGRNKPRSPAGGSATS